MLNTVNLWRKLLRDKLFKITTKTQLELMYIITTGIKVVQILDLSWTCVSLETTFVVNCLDKNKLNYNHFKPLK